MAINILNNPHGGGIGGSLGAGISSGISSGLEALARERLQNLKTRQNSAKLDQEALPLLKAGYTPDQIQFLQAFSPKDRWNIFQQMEPLGNQPQEPARQEFAQQTMPEQFMQQEQQAAPAQGLSALNNLGGPFQPRNLTPSNLAQQYEPLAQLQALGINPQSLQQTMPQPQAAPENVPAKPAVPEIEKIKSKAEKIAEHQEKKNILGLKSEKPSAADIKELNTYYSDVTKAAKTADSSDKRLDRMEQLVAKGKLTWPVLASALKTLDKGVFGFGIDLKSLMNADSQEFDKLSNDFLKDAKNIFGARLTDFDIKSFLSTVPTLSQSDEGKLRLIANLRALNEGARVTKKATDQIINENGGKKPLNLDMLVQERVGDQLSAITEMFKEGSRKFISENMRAEDFPEGAEITYGKQKPFPGGEMYAVPERRLKKVGKVFVPVE